MLLVGILGTSGIYAQHSNKLQFAARMNGAQSVPAVTTNAVGVTTIMLNETMDSICVSVSVNGLSGAITGIHIHEAAMGANGGVVTDLGSGINGNLVTLKLPLTSAMLDKMMMGMYYVNVHTAANPGGEIRGQISMEADILYRAWCDTMQQNHSVTGANPTGLATFHLSKNEQKMWVKFVGTGFSATPTGAHLHYGGMGMSGGVAIDLTSMISGNTIMGSFDPTSVVGFLDSLKMGKIYLNVHTAANMNGEVRGQLMKVNGLSFDASLDTMQQNHSVMGANPMGVGYFYTNATMDTVWYDVFGSGMSGAITGAHIHEGAMGTSGGVLVALNGVSGNRVNGWSLITNSDIQKMLMGTAYVNLHTTMNANGEIRGQVWKQARDGYNLSIDGSQSSTSGVGAGMVSIDRYKTNAHVMMVVSGLSGAMSASHFHMAPMGATGGVVYNLSSWFGLSGTDDSAFSYWTENDATTPFNASHASLFWNDSIYVNMHTVANPNGELRGQASMMTACDMMATSIQSINNLIANVELFPNPTTGQLTMGLNSIESSDYILSVRNILGATVLEQNLSLNQGYQQVQLDLSNFAQGMYIISLSNGSDVITHRVLKQ